MSSLLGATLFERMLAKSAQDRAQSKQDESVRFERDRQLRQELMGQQAEQEKAKQAEFDRQSKLAELQGKYAGFLGKPTGSFTDPAQQEVADISTMGGQAERQKSDQAEELKRYIQGQIGERAHYNQEQANSRTSEKDQTQLAVQASRAKQHDLDRTIKQAQLVLAQEMDPYKKRLIEAQISHLAMQRALAADSEKKIMFDAFAKYGHNFISAADVASAHGMDAGNPESENDLEAAGGSQDAFQQALQSSYPDFFSKMAEQQATGPAKATKKSNLIPP